MAGTDVRHGGGPPAAPGPMVVVDEAEFRRLPSAVALYRAAQAQLEGDRERTEALRPAGLRPRRR